MSSLWILLLVVLWVGVCGLMALVWWLGLREGSRLEVVRLDVCYGFLVEVCFGVGRRRMLVEIARGGRYVMFLPILLVLLGMFEVRR